MMKTAKVNNTLKGLPCLPSKVGIWIPSTVGGMRATPMHINDYNDRISRLFAKLFGGFIVVQGVTGRINNDNETVREIVHIVQVYAEDAVIALHLPKLVEVCKEVAREFEQEAVSLELNGKLYFVPR